MTESEITADISKETFNLYLSRFTNQLGEPVLKRRISFMVLERGKALDNRVKITNGQARVVQKLRTPPTELGKRVNEENEFDIPNNLESVKNAIDLFVNFYEIYNIEALKLVVQHENYLWINSDYELKISRQFGKQDLYVYEIESISDKKTPEEIQEDLQMNVDYDSFSPERQLLRRENVDIKFEELSENEFDGLINKYLEFTE